MTRWQTYDDEEWMSRTRAAFVPGQDFNAFFAAYVGTLSAKAQQKWQRTESVYVCAQQRVISQLEGRFNELVAEAPKRLTNQQRMERQGKIFNHSGKCGKITTK